MPIRDEMGVEIQLEGYAQLLEQISRLQRFPKKFLTKSAKAGSKPVLQKAKDLAGQYSKTGAMKKGLKMVMETPNKRNKTVYRLNWDKRMSSIFLKPTTGALGGKVPYAYYPQSVEWGFPSKHGYVKGKYFVKRAIEATQSEALQKMADSLNQSLDELSR